MSTTQRGEIVKWYISRFPDSPSKTLANLIYKENKALFNTPETVRTLVRRYRGNSGAESRAETSDKRFFKEPGKSGDPFIKLSEGLRSLNWKTHRIIGSTKALLLCDIHIPYHHKRAIEIAVNDGKNFGAELIILNGDITDHFSQSQWEKDPREKNYPREIKTTLCFLTYLRESFPKARIIWKHGNHEERFERYMILKCSELLGVANFEFEKIYKLDEFKIELVRDMGLIRLNKLYVIHGHEYRFPISNPVNPARGLKLRAKANAICGHFHISSTDSGKTISDKVVTTWSVGHLSEEHPKYRPLNEWNLGYAKIETSGNEEFLVLNHKIINGKIYSA